MDFEKTFKCIICGEVFDNIYKDKDLDDTCKYCGENEIFNETLHKEKDKNENRNY